MFFKRKKYPQDYLTDQTYLSGVLTGLAAGLAVGFLFAPQSGKKLRKRIASTVGNRTQEAQKKWDKTKEQARETIGKAEKEIKSVADKTQNKFS